MSSGRESVYLMSRARLFQDSTKHIAAAQRALPQKNKALKSGFVSDESNKAQVDALFSVDNPRRRHQLVRDFDKWDIRVGQRNVDKLHHY